VLAVDRDGDESCLVEEPIRLGCFSVNELRAHFDRKAGIRVIESEDPAAHARARFEHGYLLARACELARTHQSRRTGSDNDCVWNGHDPNLRAKE
jgi:hypothetical protein